MREPVLARHSPSAEGSVASVGHGAFALNWGCYVAISVPRAAHQKNVTPAFGLLDRMRDVLAECLDRRAQIDPGRSIIVTDWRDLRIDSEQLIDRHLRGPHRIFDGEDDIFR